VQGTATYWLVLGWWWKIKIFLAGIKKQAQGFGHFPSEFSLNRLTIRRKFSQKLAQTGLALSTDAILGQPPSPEISPYRSKYRCIPDLV
jgi:hypothetical protein